jgi:site-specific DNA-methyltransferase (adenine-specific)
MDAGESMKPITKNTLFYGDNLTILREHIPTESVDLIYLDPPFNSSRNYNVLFKDEHGTDSEARKARREQGNKLYTSTT